MVNLKRPISPSADLDIPRPAPRHASPFSLESQLTSQLQSQKAPAKIDPENSVKDIPANLEVGSQAEGSAVRILSKARSLSDTQPSLAPSPKLYETKKTCKDDASVPSTPRRAAFPARGLSLQMPLNNGTFANSLNFIHPAPLSPKLDSSTTYGAPASVLPRRSRGLDFSRACTNLHHSTLAESSPDSSPTIFSRGMSIPPRRGFYNNGLDSPSSNPTSFWSMMGAVERTGISSSVGSVNMMDSDSEGSSSDPDELMDHDEDPIIGTPQALRLSSSTTTSTGTNPFAAVNASPGGDWMGSYSPAAASLMRFQRSRLRTGRSKRSSSSGTASGSSSMPSPSPGSPPVRPVESVSGSGYFAKELARKGVESRRQSISMGTKELQLSSGGESDEGITGVSKASRDDQATSSAAVASGKDEKRGVIRRAVTRRGNLLPKTKNFARIRAVLMEEAAPVDTEVRREAEVIRQVRESDIDIEPNYHISQPTTGNSSPSVLPTVPGLEDIPEIDNMGNDSSGGASESGLPGSFSRQASRHSGGKEFWKTFDRRMHTPPPLTFPRGFSTASEDMALDSPSHSTPPPAPLFVPQNASQEGQQNQNFQPSEMSQKFNRKRRRDDDFDPSSFKRRAVSPGVSLQNSPILSQSPANKDGAWWGLPKSAREVPTGSVPGERSNGAGNGGTGTKRVGLQGMNDTHDGLMKMSIE